LNDQTKNQKGSPSRDTFKRMHKELGKDNWGCDIDFVFVEKAPFPDIVAVIDYKQSCDEITFSEVIAYNALMNRGLPVFVVSGCADSGRFTISRYMGGNHFKPNYTLDEVLKTENWSEFERWEKSLRSQYQEKLGAKWQ